MCVLLVGCGGGSDSGPKAVGPLPECAKPAKTISRPSALPDDLPVPPGTVFTKTETPFEGQEIISGVAPGNLDATKSFYDDALGEAGYKQGTGESEPGEAEALFTGGGVRGGWRANSIVDCEAVRLTLVVIRS